MLRRAQPLLVLGIVASCDLAGLEGNAVIALPLVAVLSTLVRLVRGRHSRPTGAPIARDHGAGPGRAGRRPERNG